MKIKNTYAYPSWYYGCANELDDNDSRLPGMIKQFEEEGMDETEMWSLTDSIAKFLIPRLDWFSKTIPYTDEPTKETVMKMKHAFELISRDSGSRIYTKTEEQELEEGLDLFRKHLLGLWT